MLRHHKDVYTWVHSVEDTTVFLYYNCFGEVSKTCEHVRYCGDQLWVHAIVTRRKHVNIDSNNIDCS